MDSPLLNLKQMVAKNPDGGVEAVQYWIVLDGKVVTSDFERKWKQAYLGTFGADASGVLVRVSSLVAEQGYRIDYQLQKEFISALHKSLTLALRSHLFGG